LLGQWGLTPQRPVGHAYQQKPEAVQKWLQEAYPRIKRLAHKKKALIFFGDEAGLRPDHHAGTPWAQKGKTPVVSSTGARFGLNIISAVSTQGEFRFMTVKGRVTAAQFMDFIKRLLHGSARTIFLIVDGHPVHKAKSVTRFMETVKDRFQIFFLPSYSPELNPDERVWNDLKNNAVGRQSVNHLRYRHMRRFLNIPGLCFAQLPGALQETTHFAGFILDFQIHFPVGLSFCIGFPMNGINFFQAQVCFHRYIC
jgi:transposase